MLARKQFKDDINLIFSSTVQPLNPCYFLDGAPRNFLLAFYQSDNFPFDI